MNEMTCATARDLMLEADLDELRGTTDSELASHIASCEACSATAAHLLRSYDRLDLGLGALDQSRRTTRTQRAPRALRLRWLPLPLAAAAVLALLITQRSETPVRSNAMLIGLMFPDEPVVTAPAGKQTIVVEKNDLTVVWLY